MDIQDIIFNLIEQNAANFPLIRDAKKAPNNRILLNCNFGKAAVLRIIGSTIVVESDPTTKDEVATLLRELLQKAGDDNVSLA